MTSSPDLGASPPAGALANADAAGSGSKRPKAIMPEASQLPPGWTLDPEHPAILRSYRFRDFSEAFGFMTRAALIAEQMDHHPDWRNVWNRVDVLLTTHDAGGITVLDLEMARRLDTIAGEFGRG